MIGLLTPTPSQLSAHMKHRERLGRIAMRAAMLDRFMSAPEPAHEEPILALPPTDPEPIPAHAERVQWTDDMAASAPPALEKIKTTVARYFGVNKLDMESKRRTADIVLPRQIAIYLAKSMTLHSLPSIGRRFGGKDHTTILHSVRKIAAKEVADPAFAATITELREAIVNA